MISPSLNALQPVLHAPSSSCRVSEAHAGGRWNVDPPSGSFAGRSLEEWRELTRHECGLAPDMRVICTGHHPALWHPGILVKYMLVDILAGQDALALNLVVDLQVSRWDILEIPVLSECGRLDVLAHILGPNLQGVPMCCQETFLPDTMPEGARAALPSIRDGLASISKSLIRHAGASNLALQLSAALSDLMRPWVRPMASIPASGILQTTLARTIMDLMTGDIDGCTTAYNRAITAAGCHDVARLSGTGEGGELPLWVVDTVGQRRRATAADVNRLRDDPGEERLLPRALLLTGLTRIGLCDLFVHGTGGARYDQVTEDWFGEWLGLTLSPAAVATTDLCLHFPGRGAEEPDCAAIMTSARRVWHDPEPVSPGTGPGPGPVKREFLDDLALLPRGSQKRHRVFMAMHRELSDMRGSYVGAVEQAQRSMLEGLALASERATTMRRDWAFPFYAGAELEALSVQVRNKVSPFGDRA